MTTVSRFLLIFGFTVTVCWAQSIEDNVFHFTNPSQGNAVWILDSSSLPWTGGYQFLRSISGMPTTLLSIVDSSTGVTLGQCVAPNGASGNFSERWEKFGWELTASGLNCNFENGAANRVDFDQSPNPRTFSVRIQSVTGPACIRDMIVQQEQATGCPPHLSKNSFTAMSLNCSCPYLNADAANEDGETENEDVDMLANANTPQFPLFKGIGSSVPELPNPTQWTLSPSPCAGHECHNNGTCLVSQEGAATCLCRNGFTGNNCELDVCSSVPCQNGGICRSNKNGIAYCECPASFTGLLCESSITQETEPKCQPECSNGECMLIDNKFQCKCRQGFTGANCNVLDVCLGDAACSMFGPAAKCVLDDNMDGMTSMTLMNGTYDCLCPHPIHGQFIDCMQLHAPSPTSAQPTEAVETHVTPSFPVLEISQVPTGEITTAPILTVPTTQTTQATQTVETMPVTSTTPPTGQTTDKFAAFIVTREPLRPLDISTTLPPPFQQHIITMGETQGNNNWPSSETTPIVSQTMTTFVFPQTPETTSPPTIGHFTQPTHKFVSPTSPEENDEEDEDETTDDVEETFPTPSTIGSVPTEVINTSTETTTTHFTSTTSTLPTTSVTEEEEDEDLTTEEKTEEPSSTTVFWPTTVTTTEAPTKSTEEEPSEEIEEEHVPSTTQTSLPFWMTSTIKHVVPEVPSTTDVIVPHPQQEIEISTTETAVEESSEDLTTESNEEIPKKNMVPQTTPSDVIHHHTSTGKQSSTALSWIIAICALIVLGLLLLATSLFILRYIRQSRKLHGKYNPAREEHNLSAAYAMPMSHIAKEERLI